MRYLPACPLCQAYQKLRLAVFLYLAGHVKLKYFRESVLLIEFLEGFLHSGPDGDSVLLLAFFHYWQIESIKRVVNVLLL